MRRGYSTRVPSYRGRIRKPAELGTKAILPMSEADLQTAVLELCRHHGVLVYHTHDSRRSQPGFPDLVIAGSRGVLFRELKSDQGKLTADQVQWATTLGLTANWGLWRPPDLRSGRIDLEIRSVIGRG